MVTLPGPFQRGRWTMAIYNRLEIADTIATSPENYAQRAVQIASESDLRQSIKARLLERCPALFEDWQVIREHEAFFAEAIEKSRAS
jgi:predicted O-linked N-acetylglucosamine transferase (SPINDLY family)